MVLPKCPICKQGETQVDYRPFCSKRCADIDLHRWLAEGYAIPAIEPPDDWEAQIEATSGEEDDTPQVH